MTPLQRARTKNKKHRLVKKSSWFLRKTTDFVTWFMCSVLRGPRYIRRGVIHWTFAGRRRVKCTQTVSFFNSKITRLNLRRDENRPSSLGLINARLCCANLENRFFLGCFFFCSWKKNIIKNATTRTFTNFNWFFFPLRRFRRTYTLPRTHVSN